MSLIMGIFTLINAWCLSVFLMLPFSIEAAGKQEGINYAAAPKKILWKRLLWGATILSILLTVALALVIKSGMVSVRNTEIF